MQNNFELDFNNKFLYPNRFEELHIPVDIMHLDINVNKHE